MIGGENESHFTGRIHAEQLGDLARFDATADGYYATVSLAMNVMELRETTLPGIFDCAKLTPHDQTTHIRAAFDHHAFCQWPCGIWFR